MAQRSGEELSQYKPLQTEEERLKIQNIAKPEVQKLYGETTYDDPEFKSATPKVRLHLADKWIQRAFDKDGDVTAYNAKRESVYKSLGINGTPEQISEEDGERVIQRIRDFQKANNLKPDGIIGPRTLEKLDSVSESFSKPVEIKDEEGKAYDTFTPVEKEADIPQAAPEAAPKPNPDESPEDKEVKDANKALDDAEDAVDEKNKEKTNLKVEEEKKNRDFTKKYDESALAYKKQDASGKKVELTKAEFDTKTQEVTDATRDALTKNATTALLATEKAKADLAVNAEKAKNPPDFAILAALETAANNAKTTYDTAFSDSNTANQNITELTKQRRVLERTLAKQTRTYTKDKAKYDKLIIEKAKIQEEAEKKTQEIRKIEREISNMQKNIGNKLSPAARKAEKAKDKVPAPEENPDKEKE